MAEQRAAKAIPLGPVNGRVKFFDHRKGYGFAILEDGREVFMHLSGLEDGRTDLNDNEVIVGELFSGSRGYFLRAVRVISGD